MSLGARRVEAIPTQAPEIARALASIGRPALAAILDRAGDTPLLEYATALHAHAPAVPLEPALASAFRSELGRLGHPAPLVDAAIADLEARRVVQTATHVTASEGPIFLAMHRLATLGLSPHLPYLVGACSGIPFSNDASPGCLNLGRRHPLSAVLDPASSAYRVRAAARRAAEQEGLSDHRISMVPWAMRDASVFHAAIPQATPALQAALRPTIRGVMPEARTGAAFVPWALATSAEIMRRCLGRELVYFDLNAVVARYLVTALEDGAHPLHRLLFDAGTRRRVIGALPPMPLFVAARRRDGQLDPLRADGDQLRGKHGEHPLAPAPVIGALRDGRLCPGVYLVFAALALQNGFRCLGGVDQVEYLPLLRAAAESAGFATPSTRVAVDALTTGRTVDDEGNAGYPLDVVLGTALPSLEGMTVSRFLAPQLPRLLGRPFSR